MSVLSFILKKAAPIPKIEEYDRFLFVGPHPDDIEIGAGATAAKLVSMGKKVSFLICIDGRFGDGNTDLKGEGLVRKRKEESFLSAKKLGVYDVRFLDFCDGGFYKVKEMRNAIAKQIGDINPEVIFCPDPDVKSECHRDHRNVGNIVKELACFAPYSGIMEMYGAKGADVKALAMYMTADTNRYVNTSGFLNLQLESIFTSHISQFPIGCDDAKSISLYLKLRAYDYGIKNFCKSAEGFRVLGTTHMHCMPEAELMR